MRGVLVKAVTIHEKSQTRSSNQTCYLHTCEYYNFTILPVCRQTKTTHAEQTRVL